MKIDVAGVREGSLGNPMANVTKFASRTNVCVGNALMGYSEANITASGINLKIFFKQNNYSYFQIYQTNLR